MAVSKKQKDNIKNNFETEIVSKTSVSCDGGTENGHPLVYLHIDTNGKNAGTVTCPYCSKQFIYKEK